MARGSGFPQDKELTRHAARAVADRAMESKRVYGDLRSAMRHYVAAREALARAVFDTARATDDPERIHVSDWEDAFRAINMIEQELNARHSVTIS